MATKKTKKKKQPKRKKTAAKRKPGSTAKKKPFNKKKTAPKRKLTKKKPAVKKTAAKKPAAGKKRAGAKRAVASRRPVQDKSQSASIESFADEQVRASSAGQSGALQGLSNVAGADSQSVDELIEEGNAFEAEAVSGVEAADNQDEEEVHTHELPEDDVPGEYLDED